MEMGRTFSLGNGTNIIGGPGYIPNKKGLAGCKACVGPYSFSPVIAYGIFYRCFLVLYYTDENVHGYIADKFHILHSIILFHL